jgi:hypothetical protein
METFVKYLKEFLFKTFSDLINKSDCNRKLKLLFIPIVLITINSTNLHANKCIAVTNGNWTNSATWSCGTIPTCGDSIIIPAGKTVTISSQQNYTCGLPIQILIYGNLKFITGNKLILPCNSQITVYAGGFIIPGSGGSGNSNLIDICNTVVWNSGMGTLSGPKCLPCFSLVLPIELLSFSGKIIDDAVELSWNTATESKSNYFDIEKSTDGSHFEYLFTIPSKSSNGNSTTQLNYSAIDGSIKENTTYYRLKHVDFDGKFSMSKLISVNYIKEKNFIIYPNPSNGNFNAEISGINNNEKIIILLTDKSGRLIFSENFLKLDTTKNTIFKSNSNLQCGEYSCTILVENTTHSFKVIVN